MGGSPGAVGTVFRGMMPVDVDGDGIPNRMDDCANDHLNDSDGDGLCANVDPCPIMDTDNDSDGALGLTTTFTAAAVAVAAAF